MWIHSVKHPTAVYEAAQCLYCAGPQDVSVRENSIILSVENQAMSCDQDGAGKG